MPGPAPKPPATRRRRNKATTRAQLVISEDPRKRAPALPSVLILCPDGSVADWHPMTRAWWRDIWRSPMAPQFLRADYHGLYRLAILIDKYWRSPTKELAGEIRLQQAAYGLTPLDRRRLEWESLRVEGEKKQKPSPRARNSDDPREALRAVK